MIIGLTGGIASGKSLATEFFRQEGIPVIDTDDIARQVVAPGQPAWRALFETFGAAYFTPDGTLKRQELADHIFTHATARRQLESITHPAIFAEVDRQLICLQQRMPPPPFIVVVVPLLFEVDAASRFDLTVLIAATPAQQLARLCQSRGATKEEARKRLAAQLPLGEKRRRADIVLDNTGSPEALQTQVHALIARLTGSDQ